VTHRRRSHRRVPGESGEPREGAAAITSRRRVSAPLAFTVGALGSVVASRLLSRRPPGGLERWTRKNHAGRPVTLFEGPAYAVGAVAGALAGGSGGSAALAGLGGAAFGALDDLVGDSSSKGLRGHLAAARRGEVTTGAVKVVGLGATGLLSARMIDRSRERGPVATMVGGAVIAGSANIVNLLDLRPGRALKVVLVLAAPLVAGGRGTNRSVAAAAGCPVTGPVTGSANAMAGAMAGAAIGALSGDLAGRTMLGDTGANSAGALLGTALVARSGPRGRFLALAVITALTLASEKVSFTKVIESTPGLRELDAIGRPPRSFPSAVPHGVPAAR
jgi:UDP-N-acetylmuramyl pentapeptide phosphotransferase/UDP-N-acetylglucosamine-1-phosphate transferase